MESGKISNALRCFSDDAKDGVLSTSNKVIINGKTAPYSIFYKKSTHVVRKPILNT